MRIRLSDWLEEYIRFFRNHSDIDIDSATPFLPSYFIELQKKGIDPKAVMKKLEAGEYTIRWHDE